MIRMDTTTFRIYHFPHVVNKKNALLALVEANVVWEFVKSIDLLTLKVDESSPNLSLVDMIIVANDGKKIG
jgi:hypothetical protein